MSERGSDFRVPNARPIGNRVAYVERGERRRAFDMAPVGVVVEDDLLLHGASGCLKDDALGCDNVRLNRRGAAVGASREGDERNDASDGSHLILRFVAASLITTSRAAEEVSPNERAIFASRDLAKSVRRKFDCFFITTQRIADSLQVKSQPIEVT